MDWIIRKINRNPNDPNKGLDTRAFLRIVIVSLLLMIVAAVVAVYLGKTKLVPNTTAPKPPSSAAPH